MPVSPAIFETGHGTDSRAATGAELCAGGPAQPKGGMRAGLAGRPFHRRFSAVAQTPRRACRNEPVERALFERPRAPEARLIRVRISWERPGAGRGGCTRTLSAAAAAGRKDLAVSL